MFQSLTERRSFMKIANNVKKLRLASGMTQAELATRLGITTPSITKWEKGMSNPDLHNVFRLSAIFDCPVSEIVYWDSVTA
jgi:transcriptional regulator with XRE-family HTH domain